MFDVCLFYVRVGICMQCLKDGSSYVLIINNDLLCLIIINQLQQLDVTVFFPLTPEGKPSQHAIHFKYELHANWFVLLTI